MRRLLAALAACAALGAAAAPSAHAFTKQEVTLPMDDGAAIAASVYLPDGVAPAAGWPAVMMFHGLGGNRASMNVLAESTFVPAGYVVMTFDFRGHGESEGRFTGLGPRELSDVAQLRERWLPRLAPIDNGRVGAWGISLGGGAILRSVGEGEPFAAIEVVETWTDLYDALVPQNLSKSGAIFQFVNSVPPERTAPELAAIRAPAVNSTDLPVLREFAGARSSRHLLSRGYPPTFFFQGRRDFAFGLEQGIAAFRLLSGPKRLYIGAFGHAPSRFPGPDVERVLTQGREWFDRFLKGLPNGIDLRPPVELADAEGAKTVSYAALPPATRRGWRLRGTRTIGPAGRVVRATPRTRGLLETFGAPSLEVRARASGAWPRLVAVLTAIPPRGSEIVVSAGGVPTTPGARSYTIRLISQATVIPKGSRLRVVLAADSLAQNPANLLYLRLAFAPRARLTIGAATLTLPVLRRPVSSR